VIPSAVITSLHHIEQTEAGLNTTSDGYGPCCTILGITAASVFFLVLLEKGRAATVLNCACRVQGDTKISQKLM